MTKLRDTIASMGWPDVRGIRKAGLVDKLITDTSFLPSDVKLVQRLSCIYEDLSSHPECPECGTSLHYSTKKLRPSNPYHGWTLYCSKECAYRSEQRMENFKKTMLENHGVEFSGQSEVLRKKAQDTLELVTGERHQMRVPSIKKQQRDTMVEKHGGYTFESPTLRPMALSTIEERFGVPYARMNEEVNQRAINTFMDSNGTRSPMGDAVTRLKVSKTHSSKTNEERKAVREKIRQSSSRKGRDHHSQFHMSDDTYNILTSEELLTDLYEKEITIENVASVLGVDARTVATKLKEFGIEILRGFNTSTGERQIRDYLDSLGVDYVTNTRDVLDSYELDIFIPSKNVAIEFNGVYWHSSIFKDKYYHQAKTERCEELGVRLVHVWEDDWVDPVRREIVKRNIELTLGVSSLDKVHGRSCDVIELSPKESRAFLKIYHIQGFSAGTKHYALKYLDNIVAVMVMNLKGDTWELSRYASSCSVNGGFTKLLTHFKRNSKWNKIVTFADRSYSAGNLYERTGFTLTKKTYPGLWYTRGSSRYRREGFMKYKLPDIFHNVDMALTEEEIMRHNGYYSLYDAGLLKYEMRNQ